MIPNYLYVLIIPLMLLSCNKADNIAAYDVNASYIYFALDNPGTGSQETQEYIDSTGFSFVFEALSLQEKVIAIPINVMGTSRSVDRTYSFGIDTAKTTIDLSLVKFSDPVIHADKVQDTLFITVQKDVILESGVFYLALKMQENEHFQPGHDYNTKINISVSNQLSEPVWWQRWVTVFGPYQREIYQLWIETYYKDGDPTPTPDVNNPTYYWNNMPFRPIRSWYPVTFMYVDKLKKYLENNPVYPNGDTGKPRIYLP